MTLISNLPYTAYYSLDKHFWVCFLTSPILSTKPWRFLMRVTFEKDWWRARCQVTAGHDRVQHCAVTCLISVLPLYYCLQSDQWLHIIQTIKPKQLHPERKKIRYFPVLWTLKYSRLFIPRTYPVVAYDTHFSTSWVIFWWLTKEQIPIAGWFLESWGA